MLSLDTTALTLNGRLVSVRTVVLSTRLVLVKTSPKLSNTGVAAKMLKLRAVRAIVSDKEMPVWLNTRPPENDWFPEGAMKVTVNVSELPAGRVAPVGCTLKHGNVVPAQLMNRDAVPVLVIFRLS